MERSDIAVFCCIHRTSLRHEAQGPVAIVVDPGVLPGRTPRHEGAGSGDILPPTPSPGYEVVGLRGIRQAG